MHLLLRLSFCAWASLTLVSCDTANSAGNLLMSPLGILSRTLSSVGRMAGASAAVDDPDSTSKSVAERGKMIENKAETAPRAAPQTSAVALR
ncbi:MAG: hypothetical protein JWO94_1440 [Verrucomicrobiaceae bacterium]|nr:hypothetical protein [Verrucomicrobiaceae bacterium]